MGSRAKPDSKEAQDNEISLKEDDPKLVKLMLDYMYTLDYTIPSDILTETGTSDKPVPRSKKQEQGQQKGKSKKKRLLSDDAPSPPRTRNRPGSRRTMGSSRRPMQAAPQVHRARPLQTPTAPQYDPDDSSDSLTTPSEGELRIHVDKCSHGFDIDDASPCPTHPEHHQPDHLIIHVRLYILADKYIIPSLKDLCIYKFRECAHFHCESELFAEAIEGVFGGALEGDKDMRDAVVEIICPKMELMTNQELQHREAFGELAAAVLMRKGEEMKWW